MKIGVVQNENGQWRASIGRSGRTVGEAQLVNTFAKITEAEDTLRAMGCDTIVMVAHGRVEVLQLRAGR